MNSATSASITSSSLVDAVNAMGQLDTVAEAAKQVAVADRLVISKSDLADSHAVDRLKDLLAAINAYALIDTAIQGELEPRVLADIAPRSIRARPEELERWLYAAGHGVGAIQATHSHGDVDSGIRSFCLWFDAPLTWRSLGAALDALAALRGADLLR